MAFDTGFLQTLVIAGGLAVSAITLYLSRRDKRPRLLVTVKRSLITPSRDEALFVNVTNPGSKAVQVFNSGVVPAMHKKYRRGKLRIPCVQGRELPCELQPSGLLHIQIRWSELISALRSSGYDGKPRIAFVVHDAANREYRSKPIVVDCAGSAGCSKLSQTKQHASHVARNRVLDGGGP